jgi:hypothetical protein
MAEEVDATSALTVNQAWTMIGRENITRQALYLAIERREIPSFRLGRRILIPKRPFLELLRGNGSNPRNAA